LNAWICLWLIETSQQPVNYLWQKITQSSHGEIQSTPHCFDMALNQNIEATIRMNA
jgi:hypothetical protein